MGFLMEQFEKRMAGIIIQELAAPNESGCGRCVEVAARRIANLINLYVNAHCTCGGCGPGEGCSVCEFYHALNAEEF
jgi:hypothetical protein